MYLSPFYYYLWTEQPRICIANVSDREKREKRSKIHCQLVKICCKILGGFLSLLPAAPLEPLTLSLTLNFIRMHEHAPLQLELICSHSAQCLHSYKQPCGAQR